MFNNAGGSIIDQNVVKNRKSSGYCTELIDE